jgi:hypothetical protein
MKFLPTGADIPDDLISAIVNGDAIFLCGARVSRRIGLPSFSGLTEQVYQELGEDRGTEPAEVKAFQAGEYDRALRSLEKRTHRPRTVSRVRAAVTKLLQLKDDIPSPDHLTLLRLSRDVEGRPQTLNHQFRHAI